VDEDRADAGRRKHRDVHAQHPDEIASVMNEMTTDGFFR